MKWRQIMILTSLLQSLYSIHYTTENFYNSQCKKMYFLQRIVIARKNVST